MAYTPPNRHALALQLGGGYTPPDRHALTLRIANNRNEARTAQAQCVAAAGRFIAAITGTVSTAQAQTSDAAGRPLVTRRYLVAETRLPWQRGLVSDLERLVPLPGAAARDAERAAAHALGSPIDRPVDIAWANSTGRDVDRGIAYRRAPRQPAIEAAIAWRNPAAHDVERSLAWQRARSADGEPATLRWRNPPPRDREARLAWEQAAALDVDRWLATGRAEPRATERRLPWRAAQAVRYAYLIRPPTPPVVVQPVIACYLIPDRHGLRLRLGGMGLVTADRHALQLALRCVPRRFDVRGTLSMSHTLSAVRLPDRLPLAVKSVSIASDRDSWTWTMQLALADVASLIAIEPTPTGVVSVEVTLDGHVFVAEVEGYTESRRFAERGGTVTARSRTVQLAAPAAPERAYISPAPATAQQLALRELDFTGFGLAWQIDDWAVPAGAWAYERATPITALIQIAEAAGAMLQSAPAADALRIAPRTPGLPWLFDEVDPDFTLAGGSWLSKGKRWNAGGRYNGVYVSGREQGVLANVYRDGTSGSPYAQLVVDPLITAIEPARGRGGRILADSLPRHEIPIELPLTPAGSAPSLLLPGELGEIEDTVWGSYRAVVDSVQISAEVSREGLVTARQSATLWRYLP